MTTTPTTPTTPAPNPVRQAEWLLRQAARGEALSWELTAAADALGRMFADPDPATVEHCAAAGYGLSGVMAREDVDPTWQALHRESALAVLLALGRLP